jgi:hypothetical protein
VIVIEIQTIPAPAILISIRYYYFALYTANKRMRDLKALMERGLHVWLVVFVVEEACDELKGGGGLVSVRSTQSHTHTHTTHAHTHRASNDQSLKNHLT